MTRLLSAGTESDAELPCEDVSPATTGATEGMPRSARAAAARVVRSRPCRRRQAIFAALDAVECLLHAEGDMGQVRGLRRRRRSAAAEG